MRQLPAHEAKVAPAVGAPLGGRAVLEVARDIECADATIVKRRVQNAARFVHRKIVHARAGYTEKSNLARCRHVAHVDDVDVAGR
jgi:hypothetical protein